MLSVVEGKGQSGVYNTAKRASSRPIHDPSKPITLETITKVISNVQWIQMVIMKNLGPLRAKKIFIRKKLGHTAVSAFKASSVTL